jgi:hypothetical protein
MVKNCGVGRQFSRILDFGYSCFLPQYTFAANSLSLRLTWTRARLSLIVRIYGLDGSMRLLGQCKDTHIALLPLAHPFQPLTGR